MNIETAVILAKALGRKLYRIDPSNLDVDLGTQSLREDEDLEEFIAWLESAEGEKATRDKVEELWCKGKEGEYPCQYIETYIYQDRIELWFYEDCWLGEAVKEYHNCFKANVKSAAWQAALLWRAEKEQR